MINRLSTLKIATIVLVILSGAEVYCQPDSTITFEAVTVEAYQMPEKLRTIPGSLSLLGTRDIGNTDATNLASIMNTLPGVSMQSGTYTTNRIVIRGMGSRTPYNTNRIRCYLNEIPLTTADGISTPEEIDLLSIGRIEVIKGPSSALYGSGLGGSLNLYTPAAEKSGGHAGVQYGSFKTAKINLMGTVVRNDLNLSVGLGYLNSGGYRENSNYKRSSLLINGGYNRPTWSIGINLLLMGVHGGIPSSLGETMFSTDPQAAAPGWKAIGGFKEYTKGLAGITLTNRLSDKLTNKTTLFGRANDQYEKRPFNNLDDQTTSLGIREKLSLHLDKTDWVGGFEWIAEAYEWQLDTNDFVINRNREVRNQWNVFGMVYYRPGPKINISIAGAVNYIHYRLTDLFENNGDQSGSRKFPVIISPRIGINYAANENVAVFVSAGHGFSMPSPEETLSPEGNVNRDIKPEQGIQIELGSRLTFFEQALSIDATVYWIGLKDLLVTKRITEDIFTGMNAGRTNHLGVELLLRNQTLNYASFPGKLITTISYFWSLNRFIDFTDDEMVFDGNQLPGIPAQMITLQFNWDPIRVLNLHTDFGYTGKQFLNDGNTDQYNGFFVANLKISVDFQTGKRSRFAFSIGVNNLTDTHYASMVVVNAQGFNGSEPRYYYPGLPRHVYAGIGCFF